MRFVSNNYFKTIFASFKKNDKKVSLETYDNLGDEINTLNVISGFSNNVEELKKEGVWLYSNNFIFSSIHIGLAFTEDVYEMFVRNKNYAIFCFQNFKTTSITFEYENSYPKKYLEDMLNYMDISNDDFWEFIDKNRSKKLWKKENNSWVLSHQVNNNP